MSSHLVYFQLIAGLWRLSRRLSGAQNGLLILANLLEMRATAALAEIYEVRTHSPLPPPPPPNLLASPLLSGGLSPPLSMPSSREAAAPLPSAGASRLH